MYVGSGYPTYLAKYITWLEKLEKQVFSRKEKTSYFFQLLNY